MKKRVIAKILILLMIFNMILNTMVSYGSYNALTFSGGGLLTEEEPCKEQGIITNSYTIPLSSPNAVVLENKQKDFATPSNFERSDKYIQVIINTDDDIGSGLNKDTGYVGASIKVLEPGADDVFDDSAKIKVRGNSTAGAPKKPYNIKFSSKQDIAGMGAAKKWSLLADCYDPTLMRNYLALGVAAALQLDYTSQREYAEVWLDGAFLGCYLIVESVEAGKERVDINVDDGDFLVETSWRVESDVSYVKTLTGLRFELSEPEEPTEDQQLMITDSLNRVEKALKSNSFAEVAKAIDIESFAKFYLMNEFFKTMDFNNLSTYYYYKNGKLYAGPAWDYDLSTGNYGTYYNVGEFYEGLYCTGSWYSDLLKYPEFNNYVYTVFSTSSIFTDLFHADGIIDKTVSENGELFNRNYDSKDINGAGWNISTLYFSLQKAPFDTYDENLNYLRNWFSKRYVWLYEYWDIQNLSVDMRDYCKVLSDAAAYNELEYSNYAQLRQALSDNKIIGTESQLEINQKTENIVTAVQALERESNKEVIENTSISGSVDGNTVITSFSTSDEYKNTEKEEVSIIEASEDNKWGGADKTWIEAVFSTNDKVDIQLNASIGATKKGPRDYYLEYSLDGSTFNKINGSESSLTDNKKMQKLYNGFILPYDCEDCDEVHIRIVVGSDYKVNGDAGLANSNGGEFGFENIYLTAGIDTSTRIVTEPQDNHGYEGEEITFNLSVTGTDLTYQWYQKEEGAESWTMSSEMGNNTNELNIIVNDTNAKRKYACVVRDGYNRCYLSQIVSLSKDKMYYQVQWANHDGTVLDVQDVESGMLPVYGGEIPMKASTAEYSYNFVGWTPELTAVTENTTYQAAFAETVNKYAIIWKNDTGEVIDTTEVVYGQMPMHTDLTKAPTAEHSYTFAGWTPELTAVTGSATYQAIFAETVNKHTITWKNDAGEVIDTTEAAYGQMPTHVDPKKAETALYSYTFKEWTPALGIVTGDAEYTAVFNANKKATEQPSEKKAEIEVKVVVKENDPEVIKEAVQEIAENKEAKETKGLSNAVKMEEIYASLTNVDKEKIKESHVNISLNLQSLDVTGNGSEIQKMLFEIHPVITVKQEGKEDVTSKVQNKYLDGSAIMIRIPIPEKTAGSYATVTHEFDDGQSAVFKAKIQGSGKNRYVEIIVTQFSTFELNFANTYYSINNIGTQVYTGSAVEPEVTVSDGEGILDKNAYNERYENNVEPGTAKVMVTILATGDELSKEFTIRKSTGTSESSSGSGSSSGAIGSLQGIGGTGTYSKFWKEIENGVWKIVNNGQYVTSAWVCDDAVITNGQNVWYLMNTDGTMLSVGLVQDATGNFYSLETNHNGYYGMLRYKNGTYDCNGQQVYLEFSNRHDGTFGAITNKDGLEKLKRIYGITSFAIGNDRCLYTSTFR